VKPFVERTCELGDTAEALRHLIADHSYGRVVFVGQLLAADEFSGTSS
jgi:hypothetical protein